MGAHLEAAERQPLLTPEDGVNANSFDPQSPEPKPHSKLNFVSKHWRGEYSLPRSFWLHGVLLGYLLLVVSCLVGEETGLYPGRIFFIAIVVWQIRGVSRSANRQGGFWAKTANFAIVWVLAWFMSSYTDTVKEHLHLLEIEHRQASSTSSTPPAPPVIAAEKPDPVKTQPWKQVGEWDVRYDNSDSRDGAPNGCFMVRINGHSGLRIGYHGQAKDYAVMFTSENLSPKIEDQKSYNLSLRFGNLSPWSIEARTEILRSNVKMLHFHTGDRRFFGELVNSNSLTISQSGTPIFEFTLAGAKEALVAMLNCQESHRHNPYKSS